MLRNFSILADEPTPTLETYFRQCSIRVTCRDLAMIGATLANGGVNPVTGRPRDRRGVRGQRPVGDGDVRHVRLLGRMAVPDRACRRKAASAAASSRSSPGASASAVFSPRLDAQGNSVRGIAVCRELAADLGLHLFDPRSARCRRCASRRRAAAWPRSGAARRSRPSTCGTSATACASTTCRARSRSHRSSRWCASSWRAPRTPNTSSSICGWSRASIARRRACSRRAGGAHRRGKTLVFTEASAWWQQLIDAGCRPRSVLCRRRLRARARREPAARPAFPGPGLGSQGRRSRTARCSRDSPRRARVPGAPARPSHLSPGQTIIAAGQASDELFVITRRRGDGEHPDAETASRGSTPSRPA